MLESVSPRRSVYGRTETSNACARTLTARLLCARGRTLLLLLGPACESSVSKQAQNGVRRQRPATHAREELQIGPTHRLAWRAARTLAGPARSESAFIA